MNHTDKEIPLKFYGRPPSINNHSFLDYPENDDCLTIFFTGCSHNCKNCQNKELQDLGKVYEELELGEFIELVTKVAKRLHTKNIVLQGGDPLHPQNRKFTKAIATRLGKDYDICVYTGYKFAQIKEWVDNVKYVVTEKFDESQYITPEKTDNYFQLASTNQEIYKNNELVSKKGRVYFEV